MREKSRFGLFDRFRRPFGTKGVVDLWDWVDSVVLLGETLVGGVRAGGSASGNDDVCVFALDRFVLEGVLDFLGGSFDEVVEFSSNRIEEFCDGQFDFSMSINHGLVDSCCAFDFGVDVCSFVGLSAKSGPAVEVELRCSCLVERGESCKLDLNLFSVDVEVFQKAVRDFESLGEHVVVVQLPSAAELFPLFLKAVFETLDLFFERLNFPLGTPGSFLFFLGIVEIRVSLTEQFGVFVSRNGFFHFELNVEDLLTDSSFKDFHVVSLLEGFSSGSCCWLFVVGCVLEINS